MYSILYCLFSPDHVKKQTKLSHFVFSSPPTHTGSILALQSLVGCYGSHHMVQREREGLAPSNKITDAGVCDNYSGSTRMLLLGETSRGHTNLSGGFFLLKSLILQLTTVNRVGMTTILYLCIKLYLWRCRSPEAMSHAIRCRIKGSGVSASATRQLQR